MPAPRRGGRPGGGRGGPRRGASGGGRGASGGGRAGGGYGGGASGGGRSGGPGGRRDGGGRSGGSGGRRGGFGDGSGRGASGGRSGTGGGRSGGFGGRRGGFGDGGGANASGFGDGGGGRGFGDEGGRRVPREERPPTRRSRRAGGKHGPGARSARARSARGPGEAGVRGPGRPGPRGSEQRAEVSVAPPTAAREQRSFDDSMIVYGRNAVHEALRGPRRVEHIWATRHAVEEPWLQAVALDASTVDVNVVADNDWIERRCGSPDHQGVCAQVAPFRYAYVDELLSVGRPLIVALDEIQDPQNLGAIARTAECAGATGIVIPARRTADVTPAVCKASAGAVEHIPIAKARNLADFLGEARAAGNWIYGAAGEASVPYTTVDYGGPGVVLVMGSEGAGCDRASRPPAISWSRSRCAGRSAR